MIGYKKPERIEQGKCFICGEKCQDGTYAHFDCCIAYSDAQKKKIEEARIDEKKDKKTI